MKEPKECEKLLALTDAMIQVQGILLIKQGTKLLEWIELGASQKEGIERINQNMAMLEDSFCDYQFWNSIRSDLLSDG